ncbi:MAG TPA: hypothetical protein ENG45_01245 [Candidatus Aenigmarchaeota archaeon]|nr:hypothetical protein [Candidatus Aenigmarchaeota archaeon]
MKQRVVCLISGGIDSPVAAWLMLKKGYEIVALFAYSELDEASLKRFLDVIRILNKHAKKKIKTFIYKPKYDLLSFNRYVVRHAYIIERRIMLRVANELAKRLDAKAIVTGDSLAQVSSQTLENLFVIDKASELPVIRPLIGMNKDEIIKLAKEIGTYEVSIRKVKQECGSLSICIRKPVTRARLEKVERLEEEIDIEKMYKDSIKTLKEITQLV